MNIHRLLGKLLLVLLVLFMGACGSEAEKKAETDSNDSVGHEGGGKKGEILVSAAASLRESLQELGAAFEKETGTKVTFNFAGSNDLAHQIVAARGADLFLSASTSWMDTVEAAGRVTPGTRLNLLSNSLVLVAHTQSDAKLDKPCDLSTLTFKNLAMGDPESVPAGTYARKWFTSVQCEGAPLWDAIKEKVAPTPDVRAAMALVLADPSVLGVVYKTDWMAFSDRSRVLYEVTEGPPINYALAQITEGGNAEQARKFHAFLSGAAAQGVFEKHGFKSISSTTNTP